MTRKYWTNKRVRCELEGRDICLKTNLDAIKAPSVTKVEWECLRCHIIWSTTVDSVLNLKSGCPKCAGNRKMSLEECQKRLDDEKRNIQVLKLHNGSKNHERKGVFKCGQCSNEWSMILSNLFGKRQGCPKCGKSGRYNKEWFYIEPKRKNIPGKIYLVLLEKASEQFIKVGITKRGTKQRFTTGVPYNITPLLEYDVPLYEAWLLEQQIIHQCSNHLYTPKEYFGGKNECFDLNSRDKITKLIREQIS